MVVLDGVTLSSSDYNVTNNTGIIVGTYTLTVTGIGNYCDSVTKSFEITKQKVETPKAIADLVYNGLEITGVTTSNLYTVTG
jgi:hypothetical protein